MVHKITLMSTGSFFFFWGGEGLIVMYTGIGEAWCAAFWR